MMRRSFLIKAGVISEKQVVVLNAKIGEIIPFLALVRSTQNLRRSAYEIKLSAHRQITQVYVIHASLRESTLVYVSLRV